MKCSIGSGLKETLQVIAILVIGLIVGVPTFFGLFYIIGWAQLHLFELNMMVDAKSATEYYLNSGTLLFFIIFFGGFGIKLLLEFIYLVFYNPKKILNFFVDCK